LVERGKRGKRGKRVGGREGGRGLKIQHQVGLSGISGLDYWTGILDRNTEWPKLL